MRMPFGFVVLTMLTMCALGAQTQVKLPVEMVGTWCVREDDSGAGTSTIYKRGRGCEGEGIDIRQDGYDGPELGCTFKKTERLARDAYLVRAVCHGDRSTWTEVSKFQISDGQLVITDVHSTAPRPETGKRRE